MATVAYWVLTPPPAAYIINERSLLRFFRCHVIRTFHTLYTFQSLRWLIFREETELTTTFKQKMTQDGDTVTLVSSGVTQKMSGVYRCVAENSVGTATCSAVINIVGYVGHLKLL